MLTGDCEVWSPPAGMNNSLGAGSVNWAQPGGQTRKAAESREQGSTRDSENLVQGPHPVRRGMKHSTEPSVAAPPAAANKDIIILIRFLVE